MTVWMVMVAMSEEAGMAQCMATAAVCSMTSSCLMGCDLVLEARWLHDDNGCNQVTARAMRAMTVRKEQGAGGNSCNVYNEDFEMIRDR